MNHGEKLRSPLEIFTHGPVICVTDLRLDV